MEAAAHQGMHAGGAVARRFVGQSRKRLALAGILLLVALVMAVSFWTAGAEGRALQRMPVPERRALYEETRAVTESLCTAARSAPQLAGRCAESAEFLLSFPECDAECRSWARMLATRATR